MRTGNFKIKHREPHPFPSQFILFDKAFCIPVPQPLVMPAVAGKKGIEVVNAPGGKRVGLEKLSEGFFGVGFKIPQGMVEVKEEMAILHNASYEGYGDSAVSD